MSRVRQFTAMALASALSERVQLGTKPIAVDAPPSQIAEYPQIAVFIERTRIDYSEDEVIRASADGTVLLGTDTVGDDGEILDGDPVMVGPGIYLVSIGTMRCTGRIWIGSRYPAKREQVEEEVFFAFNADDYARGIIKIPLVGCKLGEVTLPFGTATVVLGDSMWNGEHSFEARLWSWCTFDLDVPVFVPRKHALATHLILELSRDLQTEIAVPADVAKLVDLEKYDITSDGDAVPTLT